ncbi:504_t:CDS:2 [Entrophospora sp. SA101]|nr:504_t:CDS:2 [Entrophospora sp. SA101]
MNKAISLVFLRDRQIITKKKLLIASITETYRTCRSKYLLNNVNNVVKISKSNLWKFNRIMANVELMNCELTVAQISSLSGNSWKDAKHKNLFSVINNSSLLSSLSQLPINKDDKEVKDGSSNGIINENKLSKLPSHPISENKPMLKLLRKVDYHQNIIRFYGVTKSGDSKKYLLVLECADSGTLRSYLQKNFKSISWDLKLKFAREIASAVLCLHENNIIHRDLVTK